MSVSVWKTICKITTWGESHGKALLSLLNSRPVEHIQHPLDIHEYLNRPKFTRNLLATLGLMRLTAEIHTRGFEGKTLGTPFSSLIRNRGQRAGDYSYIEKLYRLL